MIHTCAKNQANQRGSCISGVSVLQKAALKDVSFKNNNSIAIELHKDTTKSGGHEVHKCSKGEILKKTFLIIL